ncbi:MAG TPA: NFACT RNA binding domain-containing protein, partial [Candidatus Polarisedimenticolaceae bacterium]|nr:NFACT RNA binding domain-containing protein [Candidatus Polarisedimenticolaceae bacterium]
GVGRAAAARVVEESAASGESPGHVLARRLAAVVRGEGLWPWSVQPGVGDEDPLEVASRFYEAAELEALHAARGRALLGLLRREIQRLTRARERAATDLAGFRDPETDRRRGEALLAGLSVARRTGAHVWVPDPYDAAASWLSIPVEPGTSPQRAAEACFARSRRARRGIEQSERRLETLGERLRQLERIAETSAGLEALEREMQQAGIPVGLEPARRVERDAAQRQPPRLEGVRMATSPDDYAILVGRTGRDNDRLTFRLAGPEDFWLHARGCPGAHVVVRNPQRAPAPPPATLRHAAALAAWYSDARSQAEVDVDWTRVKYVRRARGSAPGTVTLKRAQTVRVRPAALEDEGV